MQSLTDIYTHQVNPQSFEDFLSHCASNVGQAVNELLPHSEHSDAEEHLYKLFFDYSQNAGKRHRPAICMAAALAVGGHPEDALAVAAAIEHFHTAALIHDDIADDAHLRRGRPCLHIQEGLGLAINCGDFGLIAGNRMIMEDPKLSDTQKLRVLRELHDMQILTMEGQALDIAWARDGRYDISVEDYLYMATRKTAFYSGAVPLALGAYAGGGTDEQIEALRAFGLSSGLAFQIQDDLLNLVGSKEATQKDFRADITEGKRTLVAVHALSHSSKRDRLIEILASKSSDPCVLEEAVCLMEEAGSIAFARSYAADKSRQAKKQVQYALQPSPMKECLLDMADWFVDRLN